MEKVRRICVLLLMVATWLGWPALRAQSYDNLWKQVGQAQDKSLPQTVVKLTDEIYRKALAEKNSPQLLKAYLYRESTKAKLTPDSLFSSLEAMEKWAATETDEVDKAILHSLLAQEYADYWQGNFLLMDRTDVAGDSVSGDIRLWTMPQFVKKVRAHSFAALEKADRLVDVSALDYKPLVEEHKSSAYYGHDLYHLLARRAVRALRYMPVVGADSLVQAGIHAIFQQMLDVYGRRPDKVDALLLTKLEYVDTMHSMVRYEGKYSTDSEYLNALDELIERYADRPVCAEVYLAKAEWMAEEDEEGRSVGEAIRLCDEAIRRYPSYDRIGALKQLRAELLRPQISLSGDGMGYPGDTLKLQVHYRTMTSPVTIHIYATNLKTYTTRYNCNNIKDFRRCATKRIYSQQYTLKPLPASYKPEKDMPYLPSDTTLLLPVPAEPGMYVVEVVPRARNGRTERRFLPVSRLRLRTLDLGNGQVEMTTLDGRTGHPVEGVTLSLYSSDNEENRKLLKEMKTDGTGKATVRLEDWGNVVYCVAHKDKDTAMPSDRIYLRLGGNTGTDTRHRLTLLTDRSIYRPGQTVYLKGVVYDLHKGDARTVLGTVSQYKYEAYDQEEDGAHVVEGEWVELALFDVNRKQIATRKVQTGEFGSFTTDFQLPAACLNGNYQIRVLNGVMMGPVSFRVEEYKRPTFEITFEPVSVPYRLGERVTVSGRVQAFSGVSVQQLPLAYRVTRGSSRLYYAGRGFVNMPEKPLKADTVMLDATGRFEIEVELDSLLEQGLTLRSGGMYLYTYNIEATVSDEAGETQTASLALPAGTDALGLDISLAQLVCKEDSGHWTVYARNPLGARLPLTVDWRLDRETDGMTDVTSGEPVLTGRCLTDIKNFFDIWKEVPSGRYRLTVSATDSLGHQAKQSTVFKLFSKTDKRLAAYTPLFLYEEKTEVATGETAAFYMGTSLTDACVWMDVFSGGKRVDSRMMKLTDTLMRMEIPYLDTYGESVSILFNTLKEGEFYSETVYLKKKQPDTRLNVKWQVFRDRLRPGQQEEWKLVVTGPDGRPAAAEMLALMYDASLDKLYRNNPQWGVFFSRNLYWCNVGLNNPGRLYMSPYFTIPDWSIPNLAYDCFSLLINGGGSVAEVLRIRDDVMIVGYQNASLSMMTGNAKRAVASSRALYSAEESGSAVEIAMTDAVLEEETVRADETLTQPQPELRTNFAETAFFYPQLRTNEQGEIVVSFTVPQSLTRWNFRGYAHTREMYTGKLEASTVTAKEFMLKPNLPRYVRVGDRTEIAATVSNLTKGKVKGSVVMQLFDPMTEKVVLTRKQKFEAEAGRNAAVKFSFEADERYDLLGIRLVADGGTFSDGEQHLLPVLSNKQQVVETQTLTVRGKETRTFGLDSLFNGNSRTATDRRLTVEFTGNPAWYAVQALPTMSVPETDNAIVWATAYYANALAGYIANSQPRIKAVFDSWKATGASKETFLSQLEKNQEVKNILLSESPWLMEATGESEQRARMATLFDLNQLNNRTASAVVRLKELQGDDGSWSWYKGMGGNYYVTVYVLRQLERLPLLTGTPLQNEALAMKREGMRYLHGVARKEYLRLREAEKKGTKVTTLSGAALDYLYLVALSGEQVPKENKEAYDYLLERVHYNLNMSSMLYKAQCAVILQAAGRKAEAAEFEASLKEHLVTEEEVGAHFAFNDGRLGWLMLPAMAHVAAMEALARFDGNEALLEDMKLWLLKQKQTMAWNTPVTTADAVYALLCGGRNLLEDDGQVNLKLGKTTWSTTDSEVAGLGYVKKTFTGDDAALKEKNIVVEKPGEGMAWGAVYAQYLSPLSDLKEQGGELGVEKQLYVERTAADGKRTLEPLTGKAKVGDKVVARLVIRADRDMDFVQLKDQRGACFEPIGALSGYRWSGGLGYYAEVEDAGTNFFFDHLGKGTYVLEHSYRVVRSGEYETGIATLQSAYAPEFAAHSAGGTLTVE